MNFFENKYALERLLGTWEGVGKGGYTGMSPFSFSDLMIFRIECDGYHQEPLIHFEEVASVYEGGKEVFKHWETGFFRPIREGIELHVTHNTGRMEILKGVFSQEGGHGDFNLKFVSALTHNSDGLVIAKASEREWDFNEDKLFYKQSMTTNKVKSMTNHLQSVLKKRAR